MSFQSLKVDELKKVVEFFDKPVEVADEDHGPTKKELLAALASDADGSDPVSWEDYKDVYLESDVKKDEDRAEAQAAAAAAAEEEAVRNAEEAQAEATAPNENAAKADGEEAAEKASAEEEILVRYVRKNPTWQVGAYTFTSGHPFKSLPVSVAEALVRRGDVRLALPSEVTDYYN